MTPEPKDFHVYTDGVDTIFGESAEEALEKYRAEIGAGGPEDYTPADAFSLVPDDKLITVFSDDEDVGESWIDGKKTLTAKGWIAFNLKHRTGIRVICSTEY